MGRYLGRIEHLVKGSLTVGADVLTIQAGLPSASSPPDATIKRDPARPIRLVASPWGTGTFLRWNPTYDRWDRLIRCWHRRLRRELEANGWPVEVVRSWDLRRRHAPPRG